jgi:fucose permease
VNVAEVELIHDGASATLQPVQEPTPWGAILSSPVMLLICTQQFFRAAGYNFYLTWFPTYLQKTRGVSVEDSGYLTSLPLAGTVLGSLTAGVVMDWVLRRTGSRTLSRKGMALTSALATSGFLVLAYFIAAPLPAVAVLSLSAFCAGLAGPAAYTVTIDLGGRHIATVFSTMNMGGNIGAVLLPVVVDLLVDRAGWEPVLFFLAGLYVAAATCWGLVNVNATVVPDTKK